MIIMLEYIKWFMVNVKWNKNKWKKLNNIKVLSGGMK